MAGKLVALVEPGGSRRRGTQSVACTCGFSSIQAKASIGSLVGTLCHGFRGVSNGKWVSVQPSHLVGSKWSCDDGVQLTF